MAGKRYSIKGTPTPQIGKNATSSGKKSLPLRYQRDLAEEQAEEDQRRQRVQTVFRGNKGGIYGNKEAATVLNTLLGGDPVLQAFISMVNQSRSRGK